MQNKFMLPSVNTEEQKRLVEKWGIVFNQLGYNYIKVAQTKSDFQGVKGIVDVTYKENRGWEENGNERFKHDYIGNKSLDFVEDPYPDKFPKGCTGKVVYMVDDSWETPTASKSGKKTGWNREMLASHYASGVMKIMDEEVEKEVKERHEAIMENLKNNNTENDAILQKMRAREAQIKGTAAPVTQTVKEVHYMPAANAPTPPVDSTKENALTEENEKLRKQIEELTKTEEKVPLPTNKKTVKTGAAPKKQSQESFAK